MWIVSMASVGATSGLLHHHRDVVPIAPGEAVDQAHIASRRVIEEDQISRLRPLYHVDEGDPLKVSAAIRHSTAPHHG